MQCPAAPSPTPAAPFQCPAAIIPTPAVRFSRLLHFTERWSDPCASTTRLPASKALLDLPTAVPVPVRQGRPLCAGGGATLNSTLNSTIGTSLGGTY
eukprot:3626401-Prymnesium_polylepis.1